MSAASMVGYERVVMEGAMPYTCRRTKAEWVASRFAPILGGSVLDVGCDAAHLRGLVARPSEYVGVDLAPPADVVVDLESGRLPLASRSFDAVVCLDVLEHLESIHAMALELCRVSRRWVLVCLPNPLRCLLDEVITGNQGRLKHYGLPLEPRKDRHRWFFGADEAEAFVVDRARAGGMAVERVEFEPASPIRWVDGRGVDVLLAERLRLGSMWALLRRVEDVR